MSNKESIIKQIKNKYLFVIIIRFKNKETVSILTYCFFIFIELI